MKKLILAITLGLCLNVSAQDKPNSGIQTQKIEPTGNQINQSNSTSPQPSVISPSNPVRSQNQVLDDRETYREPDSRDYDYRNNIDNAYYGRYQEPPTRNEMRYRRGQQCFTQFEINARPFTLMNGYYGAGIEISTNCKASMLLDFSSGTSPLFDIQATSGMIGFRLYSKTDMVGRYASIRARARSYENGSYFGGNLAITGGYKANWDGFTLAGELGLGYQGADGAYITLPTWAITIGYRF